MALLDGGVIWFAGWTLVYDVAAWLGWPSDLAVAISLLALPLAGWLAVRTTRAGRGGRSDDSGAAADRSAALLGAAAGIAAVGAGVIIATVPSGRRWSIAWSLLAGAVVFGGASAWRAASGHRTLGSRVVAGRKSPAEMFTPLFALTLGIGLATLGLFLVRPDADDVFYVNRSVWVAEHGTFAVRDTLFSNQLYRSVESPPVPSIEPLIGSAAHLLHWPAAALTYLIIAPLLTVLATLALWRLLVTWRVRTAWCALAVAILFLLMGGANNASFGNLFLGRLWQGKVAFVALFVPLLYVNAARWLEETSHARLALLVATAIGSVGVTSSAVLVVPLIAVAAFAPAVVAGQMRRAVAGAVVTLAYPVAVGVLVHFVGGLSAAWAVPADTDPAAVVTKVFDSGALAAIAFIAALTGAVTIADTRQRIVAAMAALLAAALLAPHVLTTLNTLSGSGPVLWRVVWVLPVPALVGAAAVAAGRLPWASIARAGGAVVPIALAALMVVSGTPLWAASNHATLTSSPQWKVDPGLLASARAVIAVSRAGDVVLAPQDVSGAIAVSTSRVYLVDPRDIYLMAEDTDPAFHATERGRLGAFSAGAASDPALEADLQVVQVTLACVPPPATGATSSLAGLNWKPVPAGTSLNCFRKP